MDPDEIALLTLGACRLCAETIASLPRWVRVVDREADLLDLPAIVHAERVNAAVLRCVGRIAIGRRWVVVVAHRFAEADELRALGFGAIAVWPFPVGCELLVARIRALLRLGGRVLPGAVLRESRLEIGNFQVDLTPKRANVVARLLESPNHYIPLSALGRSKSAVRQLLVELRRQLGTEGWRVETKRCSGVRWCDVRHVKPVSAGGSATRRRGRTRARGRRDQACSRAGRRWPRGGRRGGCGRGRAG